MAAETPQTPTIIIPYPGPTSERDCEDVFVYLRPETNGIEVESCLLAVIQGNAIYRESIRLVYLANIPGDFIIAHGIIEQHYAVRIAFAERGGDIFTPGMRSSFETFFGVRFEDTRIIGAFAAMEILGVNATDLFRIWVPADRYFITNGQSVKRIGDIFVVNYDIPAILHMNDASTDIAVMILRSSLPPRSFTGLIGEMEEALRERRILDTNIPVNRAFHYSKGPFEQILDAVGYLYDERARRVPVRHIRFWDFLLRGGYGTEEIWGAIRHPIMTFGTDGDIRTEEANIFSYTSGDSYLEAADKLSRAVSQFRL